VVGRGEDGFGVVAGSWGWGVGVEIEGGVIGVWWGAVGV